MNPCGTESPSERGTLSAGFILSTWQQWTRSHCHCFFPKSVIFLFYYCSVRFCHSRKEENILETSHLPFVTKTWAAPPKQPPQTREAGGWGRHGVPRWPGPCQGPQRWGHPARARAEGGAQPLGPPFSQHLLTSHQQDHKKSYKTFFSIFPGPKILSQPTKIPRGREQQGPPCIKIWLPNNNIPKAAAYCSLQSRTWHSEKFPYNPFWILTAFNSFSEDLQTVIFSISALFCDCHRTCLVQQRGVCLVRQKCILNCTWSTSSLFTICLKLKAL